MNKLLKLDNTRGYRGIKKPRQLLGQVIERNRIHEEDKILEFNKENNSAYNTKLNYSGSLARTVWIGERTEKKRYLPVCVCVC